MNEQWQELKETITEMRDNDGIGTQQEVCKFLVNLMDILEKQIQEKKTGHWIYIGNKDIKHSMKIVECDSCHKRNYGSSDYCPNCGARMVETQERGGEE